MYPRFLKYAMLYASIVSLFHIPAFASPPSIPHNIRAIEKIEISKSKRGGKDRFSFVFLGDNRGGYGILEKILSDMDRNDSILFGIDGGDLVSRGFSYQYDRFLSVISRFEKPLLTIIGNHEIPPFGTRGNYRGYMGPENYSFSFGNSRFIIFDDIDDDGTIGARRMKWIEDELRKSSGYDNIFVFMHMPLFDPRKGDRVSGHSIPDLDEAVKLNDIFDRYGVTMLFTSHIHLYMSGRWGDTPYIVSGGAGAPLKRFEKRGFYHYIIVSVDKNATKYRVVKVEGEKAGFFENLFEEARESVYNLLH